MKTLVSEVFGLGTGIRKRIQLINVGKFGVAPPKNATKTSRFRGALPLSAPIKCYKSVPLIGGAMN